MPRSPRISSAREDAPAKEAQASSKDVTKTDRERARIARAAFVSEKQRKEEEERARLEEHRRRTVVGRERARADREAARLASSKKPAVTVDTEALENAWVDVKPML
jgi:hypothetical protein